MSASYGKMHMTSSPMEKVTPIMSKMSPVATEVPADSVVFVVVDVFVMVSAPE
jgi:hypothetical protein